MSFRVLLLTTLLLLVCFLSPCAAFIPNPCAKENKYLVSVPVLNMHEKSSENSPYVSQGVYGHCVQLLDNLDNGWAFIATEDGYQGYAMIKGLVSDNPRWRTSQRLLKVCSVEALVYPHGDVEGPALMRLPYGARVELVDGIISSDIPWVQVKLVDGSIAWMHRKDLEKPQTKSLEDLVLLSYKFLERPYVWGGTSSIGFDCSGYVQTLFKEIGLLLPRDSRPQCNFDKLITLDDPEEPGDLLFFTRQGRITHVGLYLGDDYFIHAQSRDVAPKVTISDFKKTNYQLFASRRAPEITYQATISPITDEIKARMNYSWRNDNPVALDDLRYIKLNHWGFDGCVYDGELIVHEAVAEEVVDIFGDLFAAQYPIEKMLLIDSYQAEDALSCEDNNSSAFCSRCITGSTVDWSYHSYGLAIDINPLLNPYHRGQKVIPVNGEQFLDRTLDCRGIITQDDLCYKVFISRGWLWGGNWTSERGYVDYQHFYKDLSFLD